MSMDHPLGNTHCVEDMPVTGWPWPIMHLVSDGVTFETVQYFCAFFFIKHC